MSRFTHRLALLVAALSLLSAAAFARQPLESGSADPTGKFALAGGGYLVVSVDDIGRVEGFFERNGQFGRLSGKSEAGVVSAIWIQNEGSSACSTRVGDSAHWGRVTLARRSTGELDAAWSQCDGAPTALETTR